MKHLVSIMPRPAVVWLSSAALSAIALLTALAESEVVQRVWQLSIAGQPTGSFTESTVATPDGRVRTKEVMALEMNRLGNKVSMKTESETVEASDGRLESLSGSTSSSQATTRFRARHLDGALQIETEAGGKSYEKKIPLLAPVLGPKAIEKLSREKLKTPGATVSFEIYSPELGGVVSMTRKAVEPVEKAGRRLLQVEETIEGMPGKTLLALDEEGRWVTRQQSLPFGEMVLEPAAQSAIAAAPAGNVSGELPSESYDKTMARSNIPLPDPRTLTAVTLKLRHRKPELGWPALESHSQRVLETSETIRIVEVRGFTPPKTGRAKSEERPDESFTRPNALVQSDDPEVMRIARETTAGVEGNFEKARRLHDWVSSNLKFDLGIALAPASEVVRNRRGTCIAYAVLLASLQRAAGLPSRVAMGYGYANGIWGGHAWSEVFIDGQWVALDSALYGPGTADAARLWFGASAGDDQLMKLIAAAGQMYGSVDFQVLSFQRDGRTTKVPEDAPRHTITGSRYANPWLGFSCEAPPNFQFTRTDAVFPDPAVVELEAPTGAKITINVSNVSADPEAAIQKVVAPLGDDAQRSSRKVGQLAGEAVSKPNATRFFWKRGNSLWSIAVEGESPDGLLEQLAASWRWIP